MFKTVLTKSLYNLRWAAFGWSLVVLFIAFVTMIVFDAINQQGIEQIVGQTPDSLKSLVGTTSDYTTISGYIGQQIFGPNGIMFTIIMSVILFISISASKEDNGQLQSLLSFPVSRSRVYFEQWLAVALVIGLVCLLFFPGVWLALIILGHSADWSRVWLSIFECFLMNLAYGLVAYSTAMAFGRKGLTILVGAGYAAISFIVSSLAPAVDWLSWPDKLSIYHYYNQPQVMSVGLNWSDVNVLIGIIVGLTLIGWLGFLRRDVRAS
ncbi:MAG TPA: ABC transporter permease subunit [Candidatus Saccharimonadales bacterium]|nr:ABC transporter permease subunit [Candidatus Saccharimonadales bacterium]